MRRMAAKTQQPRRDFDWDDARVLLALSRKRTLRGAADALQVNASTIARRLDALEAALALHLFERTPDGLLLTSDAEQLLAHAERIEQAALGLASAAEGIEHKPEGVVRLTAPPGVADHFIAPALVKLRARYPALRVELDASVAYSDLARGQADLALRLVRPQTGDLIATKIFEEADVVMASKRYARELGILSQPNHARWLTWGHDLSQLGSTRFVETRVAPEQLALRSTSINALLAAAETGLGVLLMTKSYLEVRPLVEVQLGAKLAKDIQALPKLELWLVGHRVLRDVPRVAAVWDFIIETIKTR